MPNAPQPASNVENLSLGTGRVWANNTIFPYNPALGWTTAALAGAGFVEVGNCSKFTTTPKPTILQHFNWQGPAKAQDDAVITIKELSLAMMFDEIIPDNLLLALGGEFNTDGSVEILASGGVLRTVVFVGANQVGVQYGVYINKVFFRSDKVVDWISDKWIELDLEGMCLQVDGSFGRAIALSPQS